MAKTEITLINGDLLEEENILTLGELCRACGVSAEVVIELIDLGLIDPVATRPGETEPARWQFPVVSVRRVRCARRLQRDLGVNLSGAALAIDLLDELERTRARLRRLESICR